MKRDIDGDEVGGGGEVGEGAADDEGGMEAVEVGERFAVFEEGD